MTYLARIAERVINRPLLLHPQKADVILWVLGERVGLDAPKPIPEENRFIGDPKRLGSRRAYGVASGAAIITIEGSLVNRGDWVGADSGVVAYEGIEAQIGLALADANVQSIVLDIDSPGGEATGMYALASKIRSAREQKPIVALVNDLAASAAYGIASQANEIMVSPTSIVGSIGVVLVHLDVSKQMEMRGQSATLIYAGAHKIDGHPFGPLPDTVKADLQRDVMTFYDRFVETVVAGRGLRLSDAAARDTEARTFIGQEAIDMGLADRIGGINEAISLASLLAAEKRVSAGNDRAGRPAGTTSAPAPAAGPTKEPKAMNWQEITAESLRQNRPDLVTAIESAHDISAQLAAATAASETSGKAAGAQAERERLAGIDKLMPAGMEKLRDELKADGSMTPEKAAVRFVEAGNAEAAKRLQGLKDAGGNIKVAGAPLVDGPKAEVMDGPKTEEQLKADYAADAKLRTEFASEADYIAFMKAEARGGIRILKGREEKAA